jgi:hypothetical protein
MLYIYYIMEKHSSPGGLVKKGSGPRSGWGKIYLGFLRYR